jgi:hypothetical protein
MAYQVVELVIDGADHLLIEGSPPTLITRVTKPLRPSRGLSGASIAWATILRQAIGGRLPQMEKK